MISSDDGAAYIELRHVEKAYRLGTVVTPVLRDLSVTFRRGSFSALVGPSGCGKSTLLALLGALDHADSGSVAVGALDLSTADARALATYRRTTVGFVFQSYNLLRSLTAVENVAASLEFLPLSAAERRARALDALARVGLPDIAGRLPRQLSGGQQQRVAIARAIARRPALLLADEPTGNLDREAGAQVFDYLRELQRELGITCIMVTHDAELASRTDHVLRLRAGRILAPDAPAAASPAVP